MMLATKKNRCFLIVFCIAVLFFSVPPSSVFSANENPEETPGNENSFLKKEKIVEVPVLKKADVDRIGTKASYETFTGLRFCEYFTVGQRIEIYQEARPIDSYMLDAQALRHLAQNQPWDTNADYRRQIVPQFTRAYGTEITMSDPKATNNIGQIRYTHDYRDVYKQYYPKYSHLGVERWDQNEIMLIHSTKIPGIGWYYTFNAGYRYSTINVEGEVEAGHSTNDHGGDELPRHTGLVSLSLAPSARLEFFGEFNLYKSMRLRCDWHYRPMHYYWRGEARLKSPDLKTSVIPGFSYSRDYYYPFSNNYQKWEFSCKIGHDFNSKLSASSTMQYVLGLREESDNNAPYYVETKPLPYSDWGGWWGLKNRVSYNIWNKFYLQLGGDAAVGVSMPHFDNLASFVGVEYYNPGLFRANFGWNFIDYYNIRDTLSTIGFKFYIFM